jgi:hypothetical protein
MTEIILDKEGREIHIRSRRLLGFRGSLGSLRAFRLRTFFMMATFPLAALAGLAGTVLMLAFFTFLSALMITRTVVIGIRQGTIRHQR